MGIRGRRFLSSEARPGGLGACPHKREDSGERGAFGGRKGEGRGVKVLIEWDSCGDYGGKAWRDERREGWEGF